MDADLRAWLTYCAECWEVLQHPICPACGGGGYVAHWRDLCTDCGTTGRRRPPLAFSLRTYGSGGVAPEFNRF